MIHPDSASASSATNPTDFADPIAAAAAITISISRLVPDSIDVLPSLALLTNAALYSLDLGSSAYLLLVYPSYFFGPFFLDKTISVFLASCSFLYPAVLRILYTPIKRQERLQILM